MPRILVNFGGSVSANLRSNEVKNFCSHYFAGNRQVLAWKWKDPTLKSTLCGQCSESRHIGVHLVHQNNNVFECSRAKSLKFFSSMHT